MNAQLQPLPGSVLWIAPFYDRSGYGVGARAAVLSLHRAGVRMTTLSVGEIEPGIDDCDLDLIRSLETTPLVPPITAIVSHVPNSYWLDLKLPEPNLRIMNTTFDSSAQGNLPPGEWISVCNEMDQIWVATGEERDSFLSAGLPAEKVQVVNWPHHWLENPMLPPPSPEVQTRDNRFRFLSIAMFLPRRRWDTLIQAYLEEFKENGGVELYLKVNFPTWHPVPGKPRQDLADLVGTLRQKTGSRAEIVIDEELGKRSDIVRLVDSCNAYVSTDTASTAPIFEAWVRQRLVVVPDALGIGVPPEYYISIPVDPNAKVPVTREMVQYQPHHRGSFMPLLHVDDVRHAMRCAYEMPPDERHAKGIGACSCVYGPSITVPMTIGAIKTGWQQKALGKEITDKNAGKKIAWEGSQLVSHSLALINRELCLQLIDSGYDVSIIPYEKDNIAPDADPRFEKIVQRTLKPFSCHADVHVRHQWPPDFTPPPHGHWVIIQPWEYGRLPEIWIDPMMNLVDELWVPSRHVLKTYIASGIPADRVHVVPNGVNVDQYYPRFRENHGEGSKRFRFLFVGGTIWRKGVDILLHAYRRAFGSRDNVALIIKDFPQGLLYANQGIARMISEIRKDGDAPEIVHYNELLDLKKMPGLYSACDCLVHPYRGEGFGLPVLEAMACGIPVITTEGGSTDDFCSSEYSYLIPSKRVDFTPSDLKLAGGAGWLLEPDLNSLTSLLREVYENGKEAKEKAMKASAFVRANFDWKKIGEKVMERIDLLIQRPIRRNGARR